MLYELTNWWNKIKGTIINSNLYGHRKFYDDIFFYVVLFSFLNICLIWAACKEGSTLYSKLFYQLNNLPIFVVYFIFYQSLLRISNRLTMFHRLIMSNNCSNNFLFYKTYKKLLQGISASFSLSRLLYYF